MIRTYGVVRAAARRVPAAANGALEDFRNNLAEQEPQITGMMLGRIAQAMDGFRVRGVR